MIDPKDFGVFFNRDRIEKDYKQWVETCQKTYGYKTKKALYGKMKYCSLWCENDLLFIKPTNQEKPGGFGPTKNKEADNVMIPANSSPEDVGKAVRLALSRATSDV